MCNHPRILQTNIPTFFSVINFNFQLVEGAEAEARCTTQVNFQIFVTEEISYPLSEFRLIVTKRRLRRSRKLSSPTLLPPRIFPPLSSLTSSSEYPSAP